MAIMQDSAEPKLKYDTLNLAPGTPELDSVAHPAYTMMHPTPVKGIITKQSSRHSQAHTSMSFQMNVGFLRH